MQWASVQVEQYLANPEYLDTAIIPIYRIDFEEDALEVVKANENIMSRLLSLEDRLKGRVILFPAVVIYGMDQNYLTHAISSISSSLVKFPYVYYIPFDDILYGNMQSLTFEKGNFLLSAENNDWYNEILGNWNKSTDDI